MAHDVFISYAHQDRAVANAACSTLENSGIRCWIAPRDVTPGLDWSAEIIEAISNSQLMILIYSEHSNRSNQIKREVERAVNRGIIIVPFRIQDVPMSKSLEYFISSPHWMDALTPPLEKHLHYLAKTVRLLLDRDNLEKEPEPENKFTEDAGMSSKIDTIFSGESLLKRKVIAVGVIAIIIIGLIYFGLNRGASLDKSWIGKWKVAVPFLNGTTTSTMDIKDNNDCKISFVYSESGTHSISNSPSAGKLRLIPTNGQFTDNTYSVVDNNTITITGPAGSATWHRKGSSADRIPYGEWEVNTEINSLPSTLNLIIKRDSYKLTSTSNDHGQFEADAGTWKMISAVTGITSDGSYSFLDSNRVSMTGPLGSAIWIRQ